MQGGYRRSILHWWVPENRERMARETLDSLERSVGGRLTGLERAAGFLDEQCGPMEYRLEREE